MAVLLETSLGDIVIDLYTKERRRCSLNFLKLCKVKYYNYCLFHSVQRDFMVQTGDNGRGGESIFCQLYGEQAKYFEMENSPRIKHRKVGMVSMVNNGENMHGSQFFITTGENLDSLDGVHTVFGEVSEGMEMLMKINESICDNENRPYQDIRIFHTIILDDPFDDPAGLEVPDRSPEPTKEQLDSGRIGVDEEVDDTKGKTIEEIEEDLKNKESKARAQILEMVGDLPEADVNPEDNVLFVCKLNSVTSDEDLEAIFSRFGAIKSCEVIRDKKTGDSLCYAFIEFEKKEYCEEAYFKMDNVLIDDRRIHVDFSQSVAKLHKNYKGNFIPGNDEKKPKYALKDNTLRNDKYELIPDDAPSVSRRRERHHSSTSPERKHRGRRHEHEHGRQEKEANRHGEKYKRDQDQHRYRGRDTKDSYEDNRYDRRSRSRSPYYKKNDTGYNKHHSSGSSRTSRSKH